MGSSLRNKKSSKLASPWWDKPLSKDPCKLQAIWSFQEDKSPKKEASLESLSKDKSCTLSLKSFSLKKSFPSPLLSEKWSSNPSSPKRSSPSLSSNRGLCKPLLSGRRKWIGQFTLKRYKTNQLLIPKTSPEVFLLLSLEVPSSRKSTFSLKNTLWSKTWMSSSCRDKSSTTLKLLSLLSILRKWWPGNTRLLLEKSFSSPFTRKKSKTFRRNFSLFLRTTKL